MKLMLVDDHDLVRSGLRRIIADEYPFAHIEEVSNGKDALKLGKSESWDGIIMDLNMPDKSGLEVVKQLRIESFKSPILILSINAENQYALRCLKAGANGYVPKSSPREQIVEALKVVLSGKKYISKELSNMLLEMSFKETENPIENLSDRELSVLKMIGEGKGLTEIANLLGLSVQTISTYRKRILEKLNLQTNSEVVRFLLENKI